MAPRCRNGEVGDKFECAGPVLIAVCIHRLVMRSIDLSETAHFAHWKSKTTSDKFFSDNFFTDKKIFFLDFWLIWFINQRALYNHALSIIVGIGVGIGVSITFVHTSPWHRVRYRNFIFGTHMHTCPPYMHIKYLVILTCGFQMAAILVFFFDLLSCLHR